MQKNRLEAFSDGVFAIVITLLILNVRLPEVSYEHLADGLLTLLPTVAVYVLSFLLIGMYWVFHHFSFTFIKEVDGVLLWMNIVFLLVVSFIPFPTMMMGRYPFQTLPIVIYGINLLAANLIGYLFTLYLRKNSQLTTGVFTEARMKSQVRTYYAVNGLYVICIALAFFDPKVSVISFLVIAVFLIIRSVIFMGIGKCKVAS